MTTVLHRQMYNHSRNILQSTQEKPKIKQLPVRFRTHYGSPVPVKISLENLVTAGFLFAVGAFLGLLAAITLILFMFWLFGGPAALLRLFLV